MKLDRLPADADLSGYERVAREAARALAAKVRKKPRPVGCITIGQAGALLGLTEGEAVRRAKRAGVTVPDGSMARAHVECVNAEQVRAMRAMGGRT